MRYAVTYKESTYVTNQQGIDMEKCSSVTFENQGDDTLTLNAGITLAAGNTIDFTNLPNEFINQPFKLVFAGVGTGPKCLVIKKFVKPA